MVFAPLLLLAGLGMAADDQVSVPAELAPFEYLIGGWKGQGIPAKNRLKGWPENHNWAWKFAKGKPVGITLEITGGKTIGKAALQADATTKDYRLEGTDPEGKSIKFVGKLEDNGVLRLNRVDAPKEVGDERLDITVPESSEKIRYTMRLFRKEPDAPQFASVVDANMGKIGESFAAGGTAADLPKCIITGGAGTMMVSFQGKSYPVCCSGCRDEFNDDPEKYVKKYNDKVAKGQAPEAKSEVAATPASDKMPATSKETTTKAKPETKEKPASEKGDPTARAASLLAQGEALEKAGKKDAALGYYKRIVKDYPKLPAAKTASAKIKRLEGK